MLNFTCHNPVKIIFGKGTIAELPELIPAEVKILFAYGGGSIKKNGVHDQVVKALTGREVVEFPGIEPNPSYKTCLKAVGVVKDKGIGWLLAVGGGSVIDAAKFIAAAAKFEGEEPWEIVTGKTAITAALPLGTVLTLPAAGSEMNCNSVITRKATQEKLPFGSPHLYPRFSILDPETTYTLPWRQTANGIVDTFVHVTEQYLTYDVNAPLQDRQAEAILLTLIEEAPKARARPQEYEVRANLMWCATQALNGVIGCGVPQDWATHMIGHELTALYGVDHGCSLAAVLPGLLQYERQRKREKLLRYAERVWGLRQGSEEARIDQAIAKTAEFFQSLDLGATLQDYDIPAEAAAIVGERLTGRGVKLGEYREITGKEAAEILALCRTPVVAVDKT